MAEFSLPAQPENELQRSIETTIGLLIANRERPAVSVEQFKAICRAAPEYALAMIDQKRALLLVSGGTGQEEIAHAVRSIEWELLGPSQFIRTRSSVASDDIGFIHERLLKNPDDFDRNDINYLHDQFKHSSHAIRDTILSELTKRMTSLAEQMLAEPPGMSQDIASLKKSITDYGFNPELNEILQKIDTELQSQSDAFDQVATMRHIRSFFERLHESVGKELRRRKPHLGNGTPLEKCGQAIDYLTRKRVITAKFKNLAKCLYAILSDDEYGVHALSATRDYTRLCRNMVVEYAVTLFFELERRLANSDED